MNSSLDPLTEREHEILACLVEGLTNREIAAKLFLTYDTVKWYNSQIYSKLQVKNRKEAIIRAQTLGMLEVEDTNPLHRIQHNLPSDTLPFIGRETEINEIIQEITQENFRLLTILAPGGMGKSRLVIELGRRLLSNFRDGVYFIPLAPLTSGEQIVTTIAETIGFKFYSDNQAKQQLLEYLNEQNLLLIMDNFEHLLNSADLLMDILKAAPLIKILATSREKLNLLGEVIYTIAGLSLPFGQGRNAAVYDSVQLFLELASRILSAIDERGMERIANICRMLGGMPLAIVLATAWLDTLSLEDIEDELKGGLSILDGNIRGAPARHQSIEAVFDYSWQRLSEHEQLIFMRLSVFRGGFTRESAKAVISASRRDLQRLVQTSFIQLQESGRYTIHELMRQYAEEKLNITEEAEIVREKHAQYFLDFITPLGNTTWIIASPEMLREVEADFENIRVAWYFYFEQRDIESLNSLMKGIWYFCDQHSRVQEGLDLVEPILEVFTDDRQAEITYLRGHTLAVLAWFRSDTGLHAEAARLAGQAIEILKPLGNTPALIQAYMIRAILFMFENDEDKCMSKLQAALTTSIEMDEQQWQPVINFLIGWQYAGRGQYDEANKWYQKSSAYHVALSMGGQHLSQQGNYVRAEEALLEQLYWMGHKRFVLMITHGHLVENAVLAEEFDKAWSYLQRGLQYADVQHYAWITLGMLAHFLRLFLAENELILATQILSLIVHHKNTTKATQAYVAKYREILESSLPPQSFESAWEAGKQLALADVITDLMER